MELSGVACLKAWTGHAWNLYEYWYMESLQVIRLVHMKFFKIPDETVLSSIGNSTISFCLPN